MSLPQPSAAVSYEEFLDFLAYMLATNPVTSEVQWIIGDVGMGAPQQTPFAYIAPRNDSIPWMTANGNTGGGTGGPLGVDDHLLIVPITVAVQKHEYLQPVPAAPPAGSPITTVPGNMLEQPGYRAAMGIQRKVSQALRENITVGGEVITTNIVETTYVLQAIESDLYRALRITLQAQQRRRRGT